MAAGTRLRASRLRADSSKSRSLIELGGLSKRLGERSRIEKVEDTMHLKATVILVAVLCGATVWLMRRIESDARAVLGRPLSTLQRRLIPAPALLLTFANFLLVLSNRAKVTELLFGLSLLSLPTAPFLVGGLSRDAWRLLPSMWGAYFIWAFPFGLLLVASGAIR